MPRPCVLRRVVVDQHADDARQRAGHGDLAGAQQRHARRSPSCARATAGNSASRSSVSGEDAADDVARAERRCAAMISRIELVGGREDRLGVVALDGGGAAQGEESHRRAILHQRRAPGPRRVGAAAPRAARPALGGQRRASLPRPGRRAAAGRSATRRSASHRCPTASHIRRTWRLRPSWIVELELVAAPSGARGPGAVRPSSSSTPVAQRAAARAARTGPPATRTR